MKTEAEAKECWCPFARYRESAYRLSPHTTHVEDAAAWNRSKATNRDNGKIEELRTNCLGSECMAWRWEPDDDWHDRTETAAGGAQQGETIPDVAYHPRGYCGLAGRAVSEGGLGRSLSFDRRHARREEQAMTPSERVADENVPAGIFTESRLGHAYAIAMCPRYGKDRWPDDADLITNAGGTDGDLAWLLGIAEAAEKMATAAEVLWAEQVAINDANPAPQKFRAAYGGLVNLQKEIKTFRAICPKQGISSHDRDH